MTSNGNPVCRSHRAAEWRCSVIADSSYELQSYNVGTATENRKLNIPGAGYRSDLTRGASEVTSQ